MSTTSSIEAPRTHHQATFAVLATAVAAYALLQSLVIPVLPTIQAGLHTTQNTVTWVLTAYLLSASIFTPIMGRLGDMHGKERLFVVAVGALAVGTLISALSTSISVMILGRVIQGIGGGVLPLAFGIIRDEFPRDKIVGAVGIIASLTAAGAGIGIVLAGPIVDTLNWHWLFWIPMIVLAAAGIATHLVIPESPVRTPGKLSWLAIVLLSGWLVALILPISEAPDWGWTSTKVIGLIVLAIVLAGAWVRVESRSANPLIDMRMMRIPAVWTTNLVALFLGVGMYAVFAFLPEFLQTDPGTAGYGFGVSITQSGLILLPMSVFMFIFGTVSGRMSAKYGPKIVLVAGLAISILPFLILAFAHGHKWEILVAMVLEGIGFGLAFAAMSNLIVAAVPPEQTGVASGMNANIRTIGGALGSAIMSSIVVAGVHAGQLPKESGYTNGFTLLAAATIVAAVAGVFVPSALRADEATLAEPETLPHVELGLVAAGTLVGDESE
ncbi:MFS transporter [Conexibacter woesei]|uniref:MFS transporter n=1 Tax=Conexibacter woesei TaxID=191495 RepID=UPI00047A3A62|nr:MFS transporter [Conexibacter woesei]